MSILKVWLPLAAVLLIAGGCASAPRMTTAERLEFYRANAGDPVRSFHSPAKLWGWRAIGDSALTVWTSSNRGFLLELANRCPDMAFATKIGVTTRTNSVFAGFDSVVVRRAGRTTNVTKCRIDTIRPLNTQVIRESRRELQDADAEERDPAEGGEPPAQNP